jgi:copper resistance protein D
MDVTQSSPDRDRASFWLGAGIVITFAIFILVFALRRSPAPSSDEQNDHQGMSMSMDMPMDMPMQHEMTPAMQAKLLADKKESEFNHHLAGFFVVLAGAFILLQSIWVKRWPAVKYVWPACFLAGGIFLLVWSDTELWPFGHREWIEALRNNREVLQHKVFAVLLLGLGVIEWQRVRGVLTAAWSGWVFPMLAIAGSVLLLFHQHEGGMQGPDHMQLMARIQSEHLSYAMAGIGIGLAKGLGETKSRFHEGFAKAWPLLMMLLGVLLMFYRE